MPVPLDHLSDDMAGLCMDPLNWKDQDHYRLLGLSHSRYKATDAEIRRAYRKMILKYHPDKTQQASRGSGDGPFKCIQKAYEVLGDPCARRAYDSVDPDFDESIPTSTSLKGVGEEPELFFRVFSPVFDRNARFSKILSVPPLGRMASSRDEVEAFYEFWLNFESTRTFEYLDENPSQADTRLDRRYFEKKNKTARAKRKTEDNARIRKLVELAMKNDPRIKAFKEHDRKKKEASRTKAVVGASNHTSNASKENMERKPEIKGVRAAVQELEPKIHLEKEELEILDKKEANSTEEWTPAELKTLTKACNTIPGGTRERWEKIAAYVRDRSDGTLRRNEDIIKKAKEILAFKAMPSTSESSFQRAARKEMNDKTEGECTVKWSQEDQRLLEDGLRKYPANLENRWDLISEEVPGKTKAQVIERFREIARAVQKKKLTNK